MGPSIHTIACRVPGVDGTMYDATELAAELRTRWRARVERYRDAVQSAAWDPPGPGHRVVLDACAVLGCDPDRSEGRVRPDAELIAALRQLVGGVFL